MMKKIMALVWILVISGAVSGQQSVDYILKARALEFCRQTGSWQLKSLLMPLPVSNESRLYVERAEGKIVQKGIFRCHK